MNKNADFCNSQLKGFPIQETWVGGAQELDAIAVANGNLVIFLRKLVQPAGECALHKLRYELQGLRARE